MSCGDNFIFEVAMKTVLTGLYNDIDTILYRQDILKDSIENASIVREIYKIVLETVGDRKNHWFGISQASFLNLYSSKKELQRLILKLKEIRKIADIHSVKFKSKDFTFFLNAKE